MVTDPKDAKQNVVDLAKVRKQMQTLKGKESKPKDSFRDQHMNGHKNMKKMPGSLKSGAKGDKRSVWDYVQLVFFLAMGAYMLQLCSGGGSLGGF